SALIVRLVESCLSPVPKAAHGVFFFFQAEAGIRDYKVTGVQTCALPICHLTSRIPGAAGVVKQDDFEAAQTRLIRGYGGRVATGIVFTVQWEIVLKHKYGQFRGWQGCRLGQYGDRWSCPGYCAGEQDRGTAHAVSARGVPSIKRIRRVARQNGDVVTLGRIQVDRAGHYRSLLCL